MASSFTAAQAQFFLLCMTLPAQMYAKSSVIPHRDIFFHCADGGNVELVEIDGPVDYLKLQGACSSCPSSLCAAVLAPVSLFLSRLCCIQGAASCLVGGCCSSSGPVCHHPLRRGAYAAECCIFKVCCWCMLLIKLPVFGLCVAVHVWYARQCKAFAVLAL